MAFNTYYTKTITNLAGNSLVYNLEKDAASTTPDELAITENAFELEYFFSDTNTSNIGLGFISKTITLEFFESNEIDDILLTPDDWRLTITLDGDTIFVGFPDIRSIDTYILESYTDLYECTFYSVLGRMKSESSVSGAVTSSPNPIHTSTSLPITDFIGEFIYEYFTGVSSTVFVAHDWQSENCLTSAGLRQLTPQLRFFMFDSLDNMPTVAEMATELCKCFFMRVGYSHIEGKTLMLLHTAGADGSAISGYDCAYSSTTYRGRSAASVSLQTLASDGSDFIVEDEVYNSLDVVFPKSISATLADGTSSSELANIRSAFDDPIELSINFRDDRLSTSWTDGITVRNEDTGNDVLGQIDNVDPTSTSTLYDLEDAITKRFATDYLFTANLKSFRPNVDKVIDPMIPITYDSRVYISPEGVINLMDETTECLLVEIQDNA